MLAGCCHCPSPSAGLGRAYSGSLEQRHPAFPPQFLNSSPTPPRPRSFLGGLTGRAGLAQLSDTFVSDPHLFFREGQSVRATVVQASSCWVAA